MLNLYNPCYKVRYAVIQWLIHRIKNGNMAPINLSSNPGRRLFSVKLKMWRLFLAIKLMVNRQFWRWIWRWNLSRKMSLRPFKNDFIKTMVRCIFDQFAPKNDHFGSDVECVLLCLSCFLMFWFFSSSIWIKSSVILDIYIALQPQILVRERKKYCMQ